MLSKENNNNNKTEPAKKEINKAQPKKEPVLKKYILAIKSLLSPVCQKASASLQELLSFEVSIDKYFTSIIQLLQKSQDERTPMDNQLISGYFTYLPDFYQIIKKQYCDKTKEILKKIASVMNFETQKANKLLFRPGDEGRKFYIILNGSVDVLIPKQKIEKITLTQYYRYLAFLIGYNEIEILNKVVNENCSKVSVEIDDLSGFGKIYQWMNSKDSSNSKKISLTKLFSYLSNNEREEFNKLGYIEINPKTKEVISKNIWFNYYEKRGKNSSPIKNEEYPITAIEYINRLKKYKNVPEENLSLPKFLDEDSNEIPLILYEYIAITRLLRGQKFGDIAVNDPLSRRTASIITTTDCHFGFFSKAAYNTYIKDANERNRKGYMIFIVSTYVFKGYSIKLLQNRYFHSFVITKCNKNHYLLEPGNNNKIFLIKEGMFELGINISLKDVTDVILFYFEKIKISEGREKDENNDKELLNVYHDILKILKENEKFAYNQNQIKELSKFYTSKIYLKISTINAPDLYGFIDMSYVNEDNIFTIKCISHEGEYLSLDRTIYNMIRSSDSSVRKAEKKFSFLKNKKLVKRLIDIRKIKIQTFLEHHPINKILDLDGYDKITNKQEIIENENNGKQRDKIAFPILRQFLQSAVPLKRSQNKKLTTNSVCLNNLNGSGVHTNNNTIDSMTKNNVNTNTKMSKNMSPLNKKSRENMIEILKDKFFPLSPTTKNPPQETLILSNKLKKKKKSKNNISSITKQVNFQEFYPFSTKSRSMVNILQISSGKPNNNNNNKNSILLKEESKTMFQTHKLSRCSSSLGKKQFNVCIGDYELKKKELYLTNRKCYLMRSTRDIFLRYKKKIDLKKKKLKLK